VTLFGNMPSKKPRLALNKQFQAKTPKYNKMLSYRRETALQGVL